ncbi:restriction endonuclease subunit S [Mycobacterium avium subsp. hominissuis]|nr:restriction endonuclease subunit S [Mycobacterium palustre]
MTSTEVPWPIRPFSEVADYGVGKTPARANAAYWAKSDYDIPWVSISDLQPYGVVTGTKETISRRAFDHVFRGRLVPAGTLLMSFKLTIGRVATLGVPAAHNEAIISIYPRSGMDQRFLAYFLSQYNYAELQDRQIKGNTLNKSKIDRIPVPVPPEAEQRAVADVLDNLRRAIDLQERALNKLAQIKVAAMQQVFARGLRGDAQVETEIGPIPESWKIGPLGDLALFQRGFDITKSAQAEDGTVPVVSSGGVKSFHDVAAVSGPGVVIGRKGSIGSVHYVDSDYWPHDTTLWCKDFRGNLPKFVFYRLQLVDMKRLDSGAANPALNRNFLHAEVISWPDVDEQQEIVRVLEAIDCNIELHRRKRRVLDQLFESLLHKLMTGEVLVDDLDLSALPSIDGNAA